MYEAHQTLLAPTMTDKLEANRKRDIANVARLEAMGWKVLLVWECELRDREQLSNTLRRFVEGNA